MQDPIKTAKETWNRWADDNKTCSYHAYALGWAQGAIREAVQRESVKGLRDDHRFLSELDRLHSEWLDNRLKAVK